MVKTYKEIAFGKNGVERLEKTIESLIKDNQKLADKIAMYEKRLENSIKKIVKETKDNTVTAENFDEYKNYWETNFSVMCSASSNKDYLEQNKHHVEQNNKTIEKLREYIAEASKANKIKNEEKKDLVSILNTALDKFKEDWMNKMIDWYKHHFNYMQGIRQESIEMYNKFENLRLYFEVYRFCHAQINKYVKRNKKRYSEILADKAYQYKTLEDYLEYERKSLEYEWKASVNKLADKCKNFGIDEKTVNTSEPEMTDKGFEIVINDKNPRRIYARVIWAAEFSSLVCPHTRYIVTQKNIK